METIIIPTSEQIAQTLRDFGATPTPEPEGAIWTVTTREGTIRFVVLDRLMRRIIDMFEDADPDRCNDLVDAMIRFVEGESQ
jgi:hypothetical protein